MSRAGSRLRPAASLCALAAVLAALAVLAPARAQEPAPEPPPPIALAGGWQFRLDPQDVGRANGWQHDQNAEGWEDRPVPSVFDSQPLPAAYLGTVGWYRLRFTGPEWREGLSWLLSFEQVRRVADVWLNGRHLGRSTDGYVPFDLPANGLRAGDENLLVIRADNRKTSRDLREGWWNWGGIVRPVTLHPVGAAHLRDLGLMSQVTCRQGCRATVLVRGRVRNTSSSPAAPQVAVTLTAPSGAVVERTASLPQLAPGASADLELDVPVDNAQLWAPEHPHLYDARVRTLVNGAVQQVQQRKVGLRSVRVRDGLLYLNGRRLQMRGAAIQEDLPGHGPALDQAGIEQIVSDLKALRANVTRAHYLLNERLLQRFDEEGILVWSQAAVYHRDRALRTAAGRAEALRTVRGTVLAARNHPSVITHSVANELSSVPDRTPGTRRFLKAAATLTRQLDPTLPVSLDILSYPGFPRQRTYARFDLLGINNYFGWYKGKADHYVGNFRDLRPYLRTMRRRYRRQAMVMTEFGAEATFSGSRRQKQTYEFQSDYLRRTLRVVGQTPWLGGAIYWTAREFAVKPAWDGGANRADIRTDAIHNKGLISYDGRPKPAAGVAAALFARTPLYKR